MAWRCAFAWIDTNRSARARFAKLVRSRRATKASASRVRSTLTPSRSSASFAARRVTSSTSSFSGAGGPTGLLEKELVLRGAPGDVEHELLLQEAGRPHRAGVVAA